mmetsp:Transcript_29080/g.79827  ORF Transcript_29080/g.79827 Transcript_29080/m.79827 type:complete len:215 (-) Transcript_29080:155-799(-)
MLDQGAQRVAVCGHQNRLAGLDLGSNFIVPVRNDAVQGRGQGFGKFVVKFKSGISFVIGRVMFAGLVHDGWWHVVGTTPHEHLVLAEFIHRFLLVQSLQGTVVTFVQLPSFGDGDPHALRLFQHVPQGANGALQERSKGNLGFQSFLGNQLTSLHDFLLSLVGQGAIVPAGELVFEIPCGFSVTDQDQSVLVGRLEGCQCWQSSDAVDQAKGCA